MNVAEISIIVFLVIIIFIMIFNREKLFKGGGYKTYQNLFETKDSVTVPPSLHFQQEINITNERSNSITWIVRSHDEIKRNFIIDLNDMEYRTSDLTPAYLSDANIDFISFANAFELKNGFSVCEYRSLYTRYDCQFVTANLQNHIASYFDNRKITRIAMDRNFISLSKRKHNVNIFIEFMYSTIKDVAKAYLESHLYTLKIIDYVKEHMSSDKRNIFVFRIRITEHGNVDDEHSYSRIIENENFKVISVVRGNIPPPIEIIIPETRNSLQMDEYISFTTENDISFSIQVEHSEGLNAHKNNMVEFLLRTIGYDNHDSRRNIKHEFVYLNDNHHIRNNNFLKMIENKELNPDIIKYINERKADVPIEINDFILVISTLVKMGYYFDGRFKTNISIFKRSPFYLAWPEFAERYL